MGEIKYRNRRACRLENDSLQVTVLVEGGHLAELRHRASGTNPLWTPPWPSIEPSEFDPERDAAVYGVHAESRLLAGIMGHNLCLDIFGGPSEEEAAAGISVHGEASMVRYDLRIEEDALVAAARFPLAQIAFERRIRLCGPVAVIEEQVRSLCAFDRPIAWTQHVTLGPPFLEKGKTQFRAPGGKSRVFETDFAGEFGRMRPGADFDWPHAPLKGGGSIDLQVLTDVEKSGGFTTHLMDKGREQAFFQAWTPSRRMLVGYVWRRQDFPWLGIWEENHGRSTPPWNGLALTRGMEFGVSPMPETRRSMVDRGTLFGEPAFRWLPAHGELRACYCAFLLPAAGIPDEVEWEGEDALVFTPDMQT